MLILLASSIPEFFFISVIDCWYRVRRNSGRAENSKAVIQLVMSWGLNEVWILSLNLHGNDCGQLICVEIRNLKIFVLLIRMTFPNILAHAHFCMNYKGLVQIPPMSKSRSLGAGMEKRRKGEKGSGRNSPPSPKRLFLSSLEQKCFSCCCRSRKPR